MEIVINACFGGFGLSEVAEELYAEKSGFEIFRYTAKRDKDGHLSNLDSCIKVTGGSNSFLSYTFKKDHGDEFDSFPGGDDNGYWYSSTIERTDPILIQVVKELKEKANGVCSELKIIYIPDNTQYEINEYDGNESVHELHSSWR